VFTVGSFFGSQMYAKGVTCSGCHDPHSGKARAPGNAVCAQCHAPAQFDTTTHHGHRPNSRQARSFHRARSRELCATVLRCSGAGIDLENIMRQGWSRRAQAVLAWLRRHTDIRPAFGLMHPLLDSGTSDPPIGKTR
jgi:predicted CXXCH cytochrome family protein